MTAPWTETNPAPFCAGCQEYRVQVHGQFCPTCKDKQKEAER